MSLYDLAVIGAGPGGYVAAIKASQLNAKVVLVEADELGGVCLNRGCIPTKSMIASAHTLATIQSASEYGIVLAGGAPTVDFTKVQSRKDAIVTELRGGIAQLIKTRGIALMKGNATILAPGKLSVSGEEVEAKRILIATGSTWIDIDSLPIDGEWVCHTEHAFQWQQLPKRLAIVGGGVVGCEFACMMRAFGAQVTVIEATPQLLPPVEGAISRLLMRAMKAQDIEIATSTTARSATVLEGEVKLSLSNDTAITVDKVLVAVGRRANIRGLNLEGVGVALTERNAIRVNERFETSVDGIFAIGDVIGGMMLAHAASAQGVAAVEGMFGNEGHYDASVVPSPIFTAPEIGCVGLTSEELKRRGQEFLTGRFPYAACGKALCDGESDGQAIVHTDMEGRILGVHIIGHDATLLIPEAALAMRKGLTAHELEQTIHAHPTLSEVMAEAAADVYGMAIHKVGRARS